MANIRINPKSGRIEVRAYAGIDPVTHETRNLYESLPAGSDDAEVQRVADALDKQAEFGKDENTDLTVAGVLNHRLDGMIAMNYSPTTVESYRSYVRCYVEPTIGKVKINKLQPYMIESMYRQVLTEGGKDGVPVSPNTVRTMHAFLRRSFKEFVKKGIMQFNPVDAVTPPREDKHEAPVIEEYDFVVLYRHLTEQHDKGDDALATACLVILNTGLSRGEAGGLQVGDYKPRAKTLRVARLLAQTKGRDGKVFYKTPKTDYRKRIIALDDDTCRILDGHIKRQRVQLADRDIKQTSKTPLFARSNGQWFRPDQYTTYVRKMRDKLSLDRSLHLHTLRHTNATYLLDSGVHFKTVQERLGHSTPTTTLGVYSHVLPGRDASAANAFSQTVRDLIDEEDDE